MRIAIFTEAIVREGGGSQMAVINFANTLSRKGHQVVLFTIGKVFVGYRRDINCEIFEITKLPLVSVGIGCPAVYKRIKEFRPDVIHLNELFSSFWIGLWVARKMRIKNITSFHTLYARNQQRNLPLFSFFAKFYTRELISLSDAIIAPSEFAKKYLVEQLGIEKKISIVHYPIIDRSSVDKYKEIDKYSIKPSRGNTLNIVTVSRLAKGKNIDVSIKAINKLKKLPIRYTIIGGGVEEKSLKRLVSSLSLGDRVRFTGPYRRERVLRELGRFDVFLSTSTMETFGITYIEALMRDVPLICIKQVVTRELLTGLENVFFAKNLGVDEVARVIEDFYKKWKDNKIKTKIKNMSKLTKFTYDLTTDTLIEVYKDILGGN